MGKSLPVGRLNVSILFLGLLFLTTIGVSALGRWRFLIGDFAMSPVFADLRQVTSAAECLAKDSEWDLFAQTCDPFGRPYNYSTFLPRVLALLGLGIQQTGILGVGLVSLFVMVLLFALKTVSSYRWGYREHMLFLLVCGSPPILLLIERGNSDLLVFTMTLGVALLLITNVGWNRVVAVALVLISVAIKFFPIGVVAVFANSNRRSKWIVISVAISGIAVAWLAIDEWNRARLATPGPLAGGFGVTLPLQWAARLLGLNLNPTTVSVLSVFTFGLLVLLASRYLEFSSRPAAREAQGFVEFARRDVRARVLTLAGVSPLLVVYLLGSSFDYRLVFLILPAIAALRWLRESPEASGGIFYLFIGSLWLSYRLLWPLQFLGDLALLLLMVLLTAVSLKFLQDSFWQRKFESQ